MTCAPKRGSAALGAQIAYIAFEMGPCMRDSDATESRTVVDERNAHGACTVGGRARNIDGAREGGGFGLCGGRCMPAL